MKNNNKTFLDYGLSSIKIFSLAGVLSSSVLLYQANVLNKYNQVLDSYNKVEKRDFENISKNLIKNYELKAAKDLVKYTIFDNKKKEELLKEISQKEKSSEYKLDSLKKCANGKSNGSELSTICTNGIMLTPIGDIVDLIDESFKSPDEKVDKVTIGLSVLGLAATVGTVFSGGTAAPIKIGVSGLKKLHKLSMLPEWLVKKIKKIKNLDDIKNIDADLFKKIGILFEKTDFEIAGKLLKITKNKKSLLNIVSLVEKHPNDIKNFMKVSPDSFLKVYNKYGYNFSIDIFRKAFLYKNGFKILQNKGKKGFIKKITKPTYPGSQLRIIKKFENIFGKITNIVEFIFKTFASFGISILSFFGTDLLESYLKFKKKKSQKKLTF